MTWKKIFLIIILAIIIIPLGLYISAIDWSRSHTKATLALPLFENRSDNGLFQLSVDDLTFRVRTAGMYNEGDPVILLHGFPELSLMWEPLMDSLSNNGFRVLAFDQRGYSPGARPKGVDKYHITQLHSDVINLANAVGFDTFHLVGHDWGAIVGWNTVIHHPDRVHTWTALSIPHPQVFAEGVLHHPVQSERSGYIQSLQRPIIPELLFGIFSNTVFDEVNDRWTPEQIADVKGILSEPGAMTAAINWYRAMDLEKALADNIYNLKIEVPTLFILGEKDKYVATEIVPNQELFMPDDYKVIALPCGHSIMQESKGQAIPSIIAHMIRDTPFSE